MARASGVGQTESCWLTIKQARAMAIGRVDGDRVWGHIRELCEEIGPRLSGTSGDERAVAYMVEHFRRCGAAGKSELPLPSWEHE